MQIIYAGVFVGCIGLFSLLFRGLRLNGPKETAIRVVLLLLTVTAAGAISYRYGGRDGMLQGTAAVSAGVSAAAIIMERHMRPK